MKFGTGGYAGRLMMRAGIAAFATLLCAAPLTHAAPTDTSFTYQGKLNQFGTPVNGTADFKFSLWDAASGGAQIGTTLTLTNATVTGGLITVDLNFGAGAFNGEGRWLQIEVRSPSGGVSPTPPYSLLNPRQPITVAPYALFALNGNPGPAGPQGPQGPAGPAGADGAPGAQGPQGVQGPPGANGADGAPGAQGPEGPIGPEGPEGPQGPPGANGADGEDGLNCWDLDGDGIQDPEEDINNDSFWNALDCQGAQGVQGLQGPAGADGAPGAQGPQGLQGPPGADGAPGAQGPQGLQGLQGPAGADGAPGAQGPQGIQGPAGADGAPGAQGPQGLPGPAGADGTDGADGVNAARYIVAPTLTDGATHTSIQAAIDEAGLDGYGNANPTTILIRPGSYTENVTLVGGVHLTSAVPGKSFAVAINGTLTFSSGGLSSLIGIDVNAPSGANAIEFGGTDQQLLFITGSVAYANGAGSSLVMSNTNALSGITIDDVNFRSVSGGTGVPVVVQSGTLQGRGSTFWPTAQTTNSISASGSARVYLNNADVFGPIAMNGASVLGLGNVQIRSGNLPGVSDSTSGEITIGDTGFFTSVAGDVVTNNGVGNILYSQLTYSLPGQSMPSGSFLLPGSGPTGPQGPAGADGAPGAQGPQGPPGANGADGAPGAQGPQGPQGLQGPAGADGAPGAQGPQGPQGLQGPPGADGAPGAAGADGEDGLNCWDLDGDGIQDPEEDINNDTFWNALDCAGAQGAQGVQGPPGANGADGAPGAQGPQGLQGVQGPPGADGAPGAQGPQGIQGVQGPAGPPGTTDWNGLTNVPAGFSDNIDDDTTYSAGSGLSLSGTTFSIPSSGVTTAMIGDEQVTAAKIANRTRSIYLAGQAMVGNADTGTGRVNFGASTDAGAYTRTMTDGGTPTLTTTLVVPQDFVAGAVPSVTIYWGTDEGTGGRSATINVRFDNVTAISGSGSGVSSRGSFTSGATQGAITSNTVSSFTGSPTWSPGDVVVLNLSRTTSDSNQGNVYIYGVKFDYTADQ